MIYDIETLRDRIGILGQSTAKEEERQTERDAGVKGCQDVRMSECRNVEIEYEE